MDEEAVQVDVTVQTPEPSSEPPLQEEPKSMEFLVGQLTEKIATLETNQQTMQQTIQEQTQEIQFLRDMDRMNTEEVYRIANEVMSQVQELREQVEEAAEELEVPADSEIDNIPVIPNQSPVHSTDSEQEKPKPAKKRPWFL